MGGVYQILNDIPHDTEWTRRPKPYASEIRFCLIDYWLVPLEGGNGKSRKDVLGRHSKNEVRVKFLSVVFI